MPDIDRDRFMTPEEAIEYGLIDAVMESARVPSARDGAERQHEEPGEDERDDEECRLLAVQAAAEDERADQHAERDADRPRPEQREPAAAAVEPEDRGRGEPAGEQRQRVARVPREAQRVVVGEEPDRDEGDEREPVGDREPHPVLRRAAAIPAIERIRGSRAASSPAR